MYSLAGLYLTAAELYEKEHEFDKALNAIENCRKNGWDLTACARLQAEILSKIDIAQAVDYLTHEIATNPQLSSLSCELQEYQDKLAKGYKYRPRKKEMIFQKKRESCKCISRFDIWHIAT